MIKWQHDIYCSFPLNTDNFCTQLLTYIYNITIQSYLIWYICRECSEIHTIHRHIFKDCREHHKSHFLQMNLRSETYQYIGIWGVQKRSEPRNTLKNISFIKKLLQTQIVQCKKILGQNDLEFFKSIKPMKIRSVADQSMKAIWMVDAVNESKIDNATDYLKWIKGLSRRAMYKNMW